MVLWKQMAENNCKEMQTSCFATLFISMLLHIRTHICILSGTLPDNIPFSSQYLYRGFL